jgi:RNA polymerase sigma factor (sigma-70 family)
MSFPQTRLTLIRRLSTGGSSADWRQFLDDYWGPICGFAMHWGGLPLQDAEDVAAETLQAIVKNDLFARWQQDRTARLRTLLCAVARNVIANQTRVEKGRKRILGQLAERPKDELPAAIWAGPEASEDQEDAFYRAWVDDLLERCVQRLLTDLHGSGKGDCFRVLYGRLCEGMSMQEIAQMLQMQTTTADNYFKTARKRLGDAMEQAVRQHVEKYCEPGSADDEFRAEWSQLSAYLLEHGGIESAVRSCYQRIAAGGQPSRESKAFADTAAILAQQRPSTCS